MYGATIPQNTGGLLVYSDGTAGTPKYRTWDNSSFDTEQSATSVGAVAIEWIKVVASPTADEWIIATRDADDDIDVQVCTGVEGGITCGSVTNITIDGGTHGFRNFDVAYEQTSGDAILVYGTNTADMLRVIEYTGGTWTGDTQIVTTDTSGTVEWVELGSRKTSNEIGLAYSDSLDGVAAQRWSGSTMGNPSGVITAAGATADTRKFDIAFEGLSGDMVVFAQVAGAGTWECNQLSGTTWTSPNCAAVDNIGATIDMAEGDASTDDLAIVSSFTNVFEGAEYDGAALVDGAVAVDTAMTTFVASYQLATTEYVSTTYTGVAVYSDANDDINWFTMSATGIWTAQADNTRTRGTMTQLQLYDYPTLNKVLLISSDAAFDLWADTWDGATPSSTVWSDVSGGATLEGSLTSETRQQFDFAFRLASSATAYTQNLTDGGNAGDSIVVQEINSYTENLSDGGKAGESIEIIEASETIQNLSDGAVTGESIETIEASEITQNLSDGAVTGDSFSTVQQGDQTVNLSDGAVTGDTVEGDSTVVYQIHNAIKLSLAPPTATRLGGVFAFTCPAGEWAYGIDTSGNLLCSDPTP